MLKQHFISLCWCLLGAAIIVLVISAMSEKEHKSCTAINIEMSKPQHQIFINENDVKEILKDKGVLTEKDISQIDLRSAEEELQKDAWIKKAELYFDNKQILQVKIIEREPLARVFTLSGNSFYIDSSALRLPMSDQENARVPVFTSFTSDKKILSAPDSLLLNDIKKVAQFISQDSFWTDMISQINITPQRTFEIVPVVGNQIIELGNADSLQNKFQRLYTFYKEVFPVVGFEKYEKIDVQYDGQIVATIRGAAKPAMDSIKAMQLLGNSMNKMKNVMNDTTYAAAIASSIKDTATHKSITKPSATKPKKNGTNKTKAINKATGKKIKPKAVLQKK